MNLAWTKPGSLLVPSGLTLNDEVVEQRTRNAKTYSLGGGSFKVVSGMGAVHYKDDPSNIDELWKDVDLTIADVAGQKVVTKAFYDVEMFTDRVGYAYTSKRGGTVTVELIEVDRLPVDNERFAIRVDGNQFFWDNAAAGVDMKLQLRPLSAEIFKQLANDAAPRVFKWRVTESIESQANFRKESGGKDGKGRHLEMLTTVSPISLEAFEFEEEWTGRVAVKHDLVTRKKTWSYDAVYPVLIDAFTSENIAANVDDGYQFIGYASWNSNPPHGYGPNTNSAWWVGAQALRQHGGVRFPLGVPQGATVTQAELKFQIPAIGGAPQAKIYADDVDDAAPWSNGNLPTGITKTTAFANWSATATGTDTIGVTNVVQEIISRPGWASGYDIRFAVLDQLNSAGKWAQVWDYAKAQGQAAVLEVTYTVVGGDIKQMGTIDWANVKVIATVAEASIKKVATVDAN